MHNLKRLLRGFRYSHKFCQQLGKIARAIQEVSAKSINFSNLYEEVMKIEGFEESMLASTFDNLNRDEKLVRSFMLKNDRLCRQWLENFFYQNS
jgi:hypothetical protein